MKYSITLVALVFFGVASRGGAADETLEASEEALPPVRRLDPSTSETEWVWPRLGTL